MFPVLFSVGPFTLHTYGVLLAGGFAAALFYAVRRARHEGLDGDAVFNLFLVIVISAIIGSRVLYVFFNYGYFLDHPLEVIRIWEGGLVFHGGLLLAVAAAWFYLRRSDLPMWRTADLAAPAIALGQSIGRLGCLAAGCCFGSATLLPLGVVFSHAESLAPRNVPLHPTQIYASLSGLLVFLIIHFYNRRGHAPGQAFWLYLLLASAARFVEDYFRGSATRLSFLPDLTAVQGISLIIIPAALVLFLYFGRRNSPPAT